MSNEEKKEQKGLLKLEFTEFDEFDGTIASKIINTHSLAKKVNARLGVIFKDYRGCYIQPTPTGGGISVTLIFNQLSPAEIGEDDILAFRSIESNRGHGTIAERSRTITNGMRNGRRFQITDDGANALGQLFRDPARINWNNASGEKYDQNGMFREGSNFVTGLDINKVLEMIYGSKNENGDIIYYNLGIMGPVSTPQMAMINNWVARVDMMTNKSMEDMCSEAGFVTLGQYNCVTGI